MNDLNTRNLLSNFRLLYPEEHPLRRRQYFECGDGWYKIIRRLSEDLESEIESIKAQNPGADLPHMIQCKEKFGRLRFYMHGATQSMNERIGRAVKETLETCEKCGEPGKLRRKSWIQVLCDEHSEGCEAFDRDPLERD